MKQIIIAIILLITSLTLYADNQIISTYINEEGKGDYEKLTEELNDKNDVVFLKYLTVPSTRSLFDPAKIIGLRIPKKIDTVSLFPYIECVNGEPVAKMAADTNGKNILCPKAVGGGGGGGSPVPEFPHFNCYSAEMILYALDNGYALTYKDADSTTVRPLKLCWSDVNFDDNKSDINQVAIEQLKDIARIVNHPKFPDSMYLMIYGHTSTTGTNNLNDTLADSRARNIYRYLIGNQDIRVDSTKIDYWSFGEDKPSKLSLVGVGNDKNRRATFELVCVNKPPASIYSSIDEISGRLDNKRNNVSELLNYQTSINNSRFKENIRFQLYDSFLTVDEYGANKPSDMEFLDKLCKFLQDNPEVHFNIQGHADGTVLQLYMKDPVKNARDPKKNIIKEKEFLKRLAEPTFKKMWMDSLNHYFTKLSLGRAETIKQYLVEMCKIEDFRLHTISMGNGDVVVRNNTEKTQFGRRINSYVSIQIVYPDLKNYPSDIDMVNDFIECGSGRGTIEKECTITRREFFRGDNLDEPSDICLSSLDDFVKLMNITIPTLEIEINIYIEESGTYIENKERADKQGVFISKYLTDRGISNTRFKINAIGTKTSAGRANKGDTHIDFICRCP
ncbi:MAG: OmpA family protein [Ignavibacteria bacterium]|jgi:outer membrane protein OmpA-like peptidoglycan-associated protein|nr:OmpA family protein [Ignavibacteria bacterium]